MAEVLKDPRLEPVYRILKGYRLIWNQLDIPGIHEQIDAFESNISIGNPLTKPYPTLYEHPDMNLGFKKALSMLNGTLNQPSKSLGSVDLDTKQVVISEEALNASDSKLPLGRFISSLVGYSISHSERIRGPETYSEDERDSIEDILLNGFDSKKSINSTRIHQFGFKKFLGYNGKIISPTPDDGLSNQLNHLFSVVFEVVTDYIVNSYGSLELFERQLMSCKNVSELITENQMYPKFTTVLLGIIQESVRKNVDWKLVFPALLTGEYSECMDMVKELDTIVGEGTSIMAALLGFLLADKQDLKVGRKISAIIVQTGSPQNMQNVFQTGTGMGKN